MDARRSPWRLLTRGRVAIAAVAALSLAGTAGGIWLLLRYTYAPGVAAIAPQRWPESTGIARRAGHSTLLMFAHPQCPCSRASVAELDRILARAQDAPVDPYVLFVAPASAPDSWTESELWREAAAIPGVRVVRDGDAVETNRFGAATSGQVLLYDAAGQLVFRGGITPGRGHQGDGAAADELVNLLRGSGRPATAAVYGCSLQDPQSTCRRGEQGCPN